MCVKVAFKLEEKLLAPSGLAETLKASGDGLNLLDKSNDPVSEISVSSCQLPNQQWVNINCSASDDLSAKL